jgi:hypothetical protein
LNINTVICKIKQHHNRKCSYLPAGFHAPYLGGLYDRSLEKTPGQVFINSLHKEYELSPAESAGILELAKIYLFGELPATSGCLKFLCASRKAKHGKPLCEQDTVRVTLTLDNGIEDLEVFKGQGCVALRQKKIFHLTDEAFEQGGLLTQEDLGC